jgi:3-methylcrotonyl-CoA carboxylase alpha subunit
VRTGTFTVCHQEMAYRVAAGGDGRVRVEDGPTLAVTPCAPHSYRVDDGETVRHAFVMGTGDLRVVFVDGEVYELTVGAESGARRRAARAGAEVLSAPMPARVTVIAVEPGQAVAKGDVLVKLEAMKMELAVRAPRDGTVTRVACRLGELVQPGVGLLEIG